MNLTVEQVLKRADDGERVPKIAKAAGVKTGRIYALLRKHRPERERSSRTRTSMVPQQVLALHKTGAGPSRIAELLDVSRQYVHRIISEADSC